MEEQQQELESIGEELTDEQAEELEAEADKQESEEENEAKEESVDEETEEAQKTQEVEKKETPLAKEEIDKFVSAMGLPKGVKHLVDKNGQLKFVIPINGKKRLATPEDVFKGFNLNQAGYQKMEEAKLLQKEVE